MKSLLHAVVSLGVVMAAFWAYASTVVPWIEPDVIKQDDPKDSTPQLHPQLSPESKYAALFAGLFGPGHWTRTAAPMVFESDDGLIALRDYETHDDGRIRIEPCAIVYFQTPLDRSSGIAPRDAIVLEAPQGAVIQLDEPVRLSEGKIGRIQHVLVQGPVTIRSDMHHPHADDDLVLHTKDVQINQDGIWCDSTVRFQYGPHFGSGRTLELRFLPSEKSGRRHGLNVGGVAWIKILKEVRLRLHPGKLKDLHGGDQRRIMPADGAMSEDSTLELTCAGPLLIDVATQVAEFRRDVEAFLVHPVGDSDKLSCEVLLVHFDKASSSDAEAEQLRNKSGMTVTKLVAIGEPVQILSPIRDASVQCRRMTYEVADRRLIFEAVRPNSVCKLQYGLRQSELPRLEYQLHATYPQEKLGMLSGTGPGWLSLPVDSASNDDASHELAVVTWQENVQIIRQEGEPVLSAFGRPSIQLPEDRRVAANEFHLWLREVQRNDGISDGQREHDTVQLLPNRLLARGSVEVNTENLVARVGQLETWFSTTTTPSNGAFVRGANSNDAGTRRWEQLPGLQDKPQESEHVFHVSSQQLQLRVNLSQQGRGENPQLSVSDVTCGGDVSIEQRRKDNPDFSEFKLTGDWLHAASVSSPAMHLAATGGPVAVTAQGTTLRGREMHFDQGNNRFFIPTPGDLSLLISNDLHGEPIQRPVRLNVKWQGRLDFDGTAAVLSGGITMQTPNEYLTTPQLTASLASRVELAELNSSLRPEFARLHCRGGVQLDRRTFDGSQLKSQEHAEMPDLTIDRTQGKLFASGPGWISTITRSSGRSRLRRSNPSTRHIATSSAATSPAVSDELSYLRVDYREMMEGDQQRREVEFRGDVRCVYGPTPAWDRPVHLAPNAVPPKETMLLGADALRVGEVKRGPEEWHTMTASGNVNVNGGMGKGRHFTARGDRLSYDENKDMILLRGDAKPAELETPQGNDRRRTTFTTIRYWPSQDRIKLDGGRVLQGSF